MELIDGKKVRNGIKEGTLLMHIADKNWKPYVENSNNMSFYYMPNGGALGDMPGVDYICVYQGPYTKEIFEKGYKKYHPKANYKNFSNYSCIDIFVFRPDAIMRREAVYLGNEGWFYVPNSEEIKSMWDIFRSRIKRDLIDDYLEQCRRVFIKKFGSGNDVTKGDTDEEDLPFA